MTAQIVPACQKGRLSSNWNGATKSNHLPKVGTNKAAIFRFKFPIEHRRQAFAFVIPERSSHFSSPFQDHPQFWQSVFKFLSPLKKVPILYQFGLHVNCNQLRLTLDKSSKLLAGWNWFQLFLVQVQSNKVNCSGIFAVGIYRFSSAVLLSLSATIDFPPPSSFTRAPWLAMTHLVNCAFSTLLVFSPTFSTFSSSSPPPPAPPDSPLSPSLPSILPLPAVSWRHIKSLQEKASVNKSASNWFYVIWWLTQICDWWKSCWAFLHIQRTKGLSTDNNKV